MTLHDYLAQLQKRYQSGMAKEHAYRADLEHLLRALAPTMEITNEPANVTDCGNPDFVITNGKIPIGYIEAKDLGKDLNSKQYHEQFSRYRKALDNLIITDYLYFQFFRHDELVHEVRLGEIQGGKIVPLPDNFAYFANLIAEFCAFIGQTITSASKLAELMAAKARLLQIILEQAVTSDVQSADQTALKDQLKAFQQILIHDLAPKEFADLYAQTLAYGLFAARLHDPSLSTFTRQEAAELIPKTNPFLRKLFQYILLEEIDERVKTTVDNLAEVFRAADVNAIMHNFGKATQQTDPVIHFYETFLAAYDPKLRKSRGVWYTPAPVVNFIVRAVDDLLKNEFGLSQGLADTSKITITTTEQGTNKPVKQEVHKVQILDPAAGTGTFLADIIRHLYATRFKAMQGAWSTYVERDLLPRLNGFELLMASYTMAHLKLDLLLQETKYQPEKPKRFNIYLTNSLEEHHPDSETLWATFLANEAREANRIKRDAPVMVVLGNPPYSGHSANKGDWIEGLLDNYKKEPGGGKLQEKNPKWLNDDYVKFIRYGQHFVEKNGEGILAFINNHSFLDNPTFRGMRWHLLTTFDAIYIIDLHGNSKKKETCPDGSPDKNVFDIQQGVSINLFVKTGKKKKNALGKVFHYDLYGERETKYNFLWKNNLNSIPFKNLLYCPNYYLFTPTDFSNNSDYQKGFKLNDCFELNSTGYYTSCDDIVISSSHEDIQHKVEKNLPQVCYFDEKLIHKTAYRPFDNRFIYYDHNLLTRSRSKFVAKFLSQQNFILISGKSTKSKGINHFFISKYFSELKCGEYTLGSYMFPLYLYPDNSAQQTFGETPTRTPNLNMAIVQRIADALGLRFVPESVQTHGRDVETHGRASLRETFAPLDLLDYIYAVLHSPTYRDTYKEFLKIDFPRVPYPSNADTFWQLVALGGELRQMHLLESPTVEQFITTYPQDGNNVVGKVRFDHVETHGRASLPPVGHVWINDAQYFSGVPQAAWELYIGGYQPAQKWLKDRQGRALSFEDILHYQKIIVALTETDRLMREIDMIPLN